MSIECMAVGARSWNQRLAQEVFRNRVDSSEEEVDNDRPTAFRAFCTFVISLKRPRSEAWARVEEEGTP